MKMGKEKRRERGGIEREERERKNRRKPKPTHTNDEMVDLIFFLSVCKSTVARMLCNKIKFYAPRHILSVKSFEV